MQNSQVTPTTTLEVLQQFTRGINSLSHGSDGPVLKKGQILKALSKSNYRCKYPSDTHSQVC